MSPRRSRRRDAADSSATASGRSARRDASAASPARRQTLTARLRIPPTIRLVFAHASVSITRGGKRLAALRVERRAPSGNRSRGRATTPARGGLPRTACRSSADRLRAARRRSARPGVRTSTGGTASAARPRRQRASALMSTLSISFCCSQSIDSATYLAARSVSSAASRARRFGLSGSSGGRLRPVTSARCSGSSAVVSPMMSSAASSTTLPGQAVPDCARHEPSMHRRECPAPSRGSRSAAPHRTRPSATPGTAVLAAGLLVVERQRFFQAGVAALLHQASAFAVSATKLRATALAARTRCEQDDGDESRRRIGATLDTVFAEIGFVIFGIA